MGLISRIGNAIHHLIDKVKDGIQAVAESIRSTVQSLVNAVKSVGNAVQCLMRGDLAGALKCAVSALKDVAKVAAFAVCPGMSLASSFVAGSVGGKAGEALGMLTGGPKALLTKGGLAEIARDTTKDAMFQQAMA